MRRCLKSFSDCAMPLVTSHPRSWHRAGQATSYLSVRTNFSRRGDPRQNRYLRLLLTRAHVVDASLVQLRIKSKYRGKGRQSPQIPSRWRRKGKKNRTRCVVLEKTRGDLNARDTHLEIFEERRVSSPIYLRKQILIEHFAH